MTCSCVEWPLNKITMKKLLALLLLVCATAVGAQTTNRNYQITWTPSPSVYTGPTNVIFSPGTNFVYWQTNVTLPLNQWMLLTTTPDNQVIGNNYVAISVWAGTITIPVGANVFAVMQYGNSSGLSSFSNMAGTASTALPNAVQTFRLQ